MLLKTLKQQGISILFLWAPPTKPISIATVCLLRREEVIGVIRQGFMQHTQLLIHLLLLKAAALFDQLSRSQFTHHAILEILRFYHDQFTCHRYASHTE